MSKKFQSFIVFSIITSVLILGIWLYLGKNFRTSVEDSFSNVIRKSTGDNLSVSYSIARLSGFPSGFKVKLYNARLKSGGKNGNWYADFKGAIEVTSSLFSDSLYVSFPENFDIYTKPSDVDSKDLEKEKVVNISFQSSPVFKVIFSYSSWLPWWLGNNDVMTDDEIVVVSFAGEVPPAYINLSSDVEDEADVYPAIKKIPLWGKAEILANIDQGAAYRENIDLSFLVDGLNLKYIFDKNNLIKSNELPVSLKMSLSLDVPSEPDLYEVEPFSVNLNEFKLQGNEAGIDLSGELIYKEDAVLKSGNGVLYISGLDSLVKSSSPYIEKYKLLKRYKDSEWYRKRLRSFLKKYFLVDGKSLTDRSGFYVSNIKVKDNGVWHINDNSADYVRKRLQERFGD